MKLIKPSVELVTVTPNALQVIEQAGRICYKSEGSITDDSAGRFVQNIIKRDHGAVLEHAGATIKFVCDRGVSHEIVRHRVASYCQESTRYCNYSQGKFGSEVTYVKPTWVELQYDLRPISEFLEACKDAERHYLNLIKCGLKPEEARAVLPTCVKTELVMTANMREWRHFFKLRCSKRAHPDMRRVAKLALIELHNAVPVVFDDLYSQFIEGDQD